MKRSGKRRDREKQRWQKAGSRKNTDTKSRDYSQARITDTDTKPWEDGKKQKEVGSMQRAEGTKTFKNGENRVSGY